MAIKLEDIAAIAGVSKATVSLALNGNPAVKEETRDRVLRIAKEHEYIPNRSARNLVQRRNSSIGVIVPDIESEYYGKLVNSLNMAIRDIGYTMLLSLSDNDSYQERMAVRNFISNDVAGVVIVPINKEPQDIRHFALLDNNKIPYLFATSYYPTVKHRCVMVDLEQGSYSMAKYLIRTGRTKIRFFCGSSAIIPTSTRLHGLCRAFQESGLTIPENLSVEFSDINYSAAYHYVQSYHSALRDVDAIMTVNDMMALGVINALRDLGVRVPEDIAVAGYDNVAYSTVSSVPITTINQDLGRLGRDTVNLLKNEIDNKDFGPDEQLINYIPPDLIIRAST